MAAMRLAARLDDIAAPRHHRDRQADARPVVGSHHPVRVEDLDDARLVDIAGADLRDLVTRAARCGVARAQQLRLAIGLDPLGRDLNGVPDALAHRPEVDLADIAVRSARGQRVRDRFRHPKEALLAEPVDVAEVRALADDEPHRGADLVARLRALDAPVVEREAEAMAPLAVELREVAAATQGAVEHRSCELGFEEAHEAGGAALSGSASGAASLAPDRSISFSAASMRLARSSLPAGTIRGSPDASYTTARGSRSRCRRRTPPEIVSAIRAAIELRCSLLRAAGRGRRARGPGRSTSARRGRTPR